MAIIKTYPLKNNYYGPDKFLISDMQPDSEGNVSGDTKNITFSSLKSLIGPGAPVLTLTTENTSGAATFDVNTNTLNVPVYEGDTYNLRALQKSGASVPLKLNAASGTDSEVSFTEGANITLTRDSDTEITISATGGNAGVSSISNAFGTYISGTNNTAATGAVGLGTINLSAINGTSIATTRFLSKDNTWDVISASGSTGSVQFKASTGGFQGDTSFIFESSNDKLIVGDTSNDNSGTIEIQSDENGGTLKIGGGSQQYYTSIKGSDSDTADYNIILPPAGPGGNNKILESTSAGILSWIPTPTGGGGTVTSVGLTMPSAFSVGNSPITANGNISVGVTGGSAGQYLDYQGNWSTPTKGLTSVGLSAPPAFSVTGSPLTSNGSISIGVTGGSSGEFLAANGQWATPAAGTTSVTNGNPSASTGSALTISPNTGAVIVTSKAYAGTNKVGHVPAGGTASTFLRGDATWVTPTASLDFFKTIATPTNDVIASGNNDTLTLAAGSNTGIFINGSGSQVTIGLSAPTTLARGGIKLVSATQQSITANGLTTTAGRTYAIQLNSSGQAVVNVPWVSGSGGGISFSGTTSGGLATFTNSSTAGVSSKVTLNASGLMNFDADGNSAGSIDYDGTDNVRRLKIGDLSTGNSGIVEVFTDGTRQFQFGVNGEIGLGENASQGTSGQVLTSQGNGSPAIWSSSGGQNIANTNLTQTATRTYAMAQYALTFTGTSSISMQQSNGLVVNGNIISNSQSYAAKNSISNKNTSFTIDCNDGNVQQVNLTNGSGNVIISFSNVRAGARYTVITTRLGFEGGYGTYSFNSVLWPNNSTPQNVPAGAGTFNMYEFVATTSASSGMLGYFFRNYQTAS